MSDLRVELILNVRNDHSMRRAASKEAPGGEEWVCRCGTAFQGDGALIKGNRHRAEVTLAALDEAAMTP